jgi:septin family protein
MRDIRTRTTEEVGREARMGSFDTEHIRTIALVGQGGSGKTTLIEKLLEHSGAISAAGSIERGSTVCDYDPREKEHKHSVNLAVTNVSHDGTLIHLLDTPGYLDFVGQSPAHDELGTVAKPVPRHHRQSHRCRRCRSGRLAR